MGARPAAQDCLIQAIRSSATRGARLAHLSDAALAAALSAHATVIEPYSPLSDAIGEAVYRLSKPHRTAFEAPEIRISSAEKDFALQVAI